MLQRAADERFGEKPGRGLFGGGRREFGMFSPGGRALVFGDGGGALGLPKFIERAVEFLRRTQIVLERNWTARSRASRRLPKCNAAWLTMHEGEMK